MEYQTESELAALVELYRALPERRYVLEIGSMMGDTLRQWLEHGDPGMKIVSVDKVVPPSDSRHAAQMAAHGIWPSWAAAEAATLTVIDGYSQAPETIAAVKELKSEKDADILQLKARADRAESDALQLKARVDKAEAESAQLKIFLCGQFPAAPICQ